MLRWKLPTLALLLVLVGCDGDLTVDNGSALPTETITILLGGQCRTAGSRIECEDSSQSSPSGQLLSVTWELRSSTTGISLDRQQQEPEAEVSFSGLASGTYEVEQKVDATDGSSVQQIHGDLLIS